MARVGVLVIALILVGLSRSAAQPQPPKFARQFSVAIEANIGRFNQTLNLREWNDADARLARYEIVSMTDVKSYIVNWATNQVWTVTNMAYCEVTTFDLAADPFGYLPDGYLGLESLLRFNLSSGDRYIGQEYVRGMLCDGWQTSFNYTGFNGSRTDVSMAFWFSSPSWGTQFTRTNSSHPVRATLNGTHTYLNGKVEYIDNDYEFVGFVAAAPLKSYFLLPDECLPVQEALLRYVLTSTGGGLAAGMFFLGLVLGVIIWIFICIGYKKYRDRQSSRYAAMKTPLDPSGMNSSDNVGMDNL